MYIQYVGIHVCNSMATGLYVYKSTKINIDPIISIKVFQCLDDTYDLTLYV